jgi:hypothetical protein
LSDEEKKQLPEAFEKHNGDFEKIIEESPYKEKLEKELEEVTKNVKEGYKKGLESHHKLATKGQTPAKPEPATSEDTDPKPAPAKQKTD